MQVRRFFRPEDISADLRYAADWWDLYAPSGAAAEQVRRRRVRVLTPCQSCRRLSTLCSITVARQGVTQANLGLLLRVLA